MIALRAAYAGAVMAATLTIASPAHAGPTPGFPATVPISSAVAHRTIDRWIRVRVMPMLPAHTRYSVGHCTGTRYVKDCPVRFAGSGTVCSGAYEVWQDERNWYTDLRHYVCKPD